MKLDLDCVRDILLEVEKCRYNEALPISTLEKRLTKHFNEDIRYNCLKLYEAKYIDAVCISIDNSALPYICEIRDITYKGHEFLANIRNEKSWDNVKEIGKKVGFLGLGSAFEIAAGIASSTIKQHLGLP